MARTIAEISGTAGTTATSSIPLDKLGPPGIVTILDVIPTFEGEAESGEERFLDRAPRQFVVLARLSDTNSPSRHIHFSVEKDSGNSLLKVPSDTLALKVETANGSFLLYPNKTHRLSTIKFECVAKSNNEARALFHSMVGPAIDHLSYLTSSPLFIVQISVEDQLHHISSTEILCPYPLVPLPDLGVTPIISVLHPVYAMYREAINATSPFYKFFCLYKILEGLLKSLNSKVYTKAKAKAITLPPLQAKVPAYEGMPSEQQEYAGKSVTRFFNDFITPKYRNPMAHFMSDEGGVLNVNEMNGIHQYTAVIHVMDLCCREVIQHFETCLRMINKSPS